jgi:UDP-N-acetylmuramyl pentapeptide phosphotransferase/UDP-N-acetylglucosamine-1-phosphate transferase
LKKKFIDLINKRSSHNVISTRSGGLAIFISIFIICIFSYLNNITLFNYKIIVPLSVLLVVGCYDDVFKLDYKFKFIFQIIVAKILIDNGFIIDNLHGLMGVFEINRIIAQLFTMFIIVAIINSLNFIDGIDGLAISVVFLFLFWYEFFSLFQSDFYFLSIILIGSLAPLFYFNFRKKNKVFLGDAGSLFLGAIISVYTLNILSQNYFIKDEFDINKIIFVISILVYPIIDIIRVFFIRLKQRKSPFIADKNHIHHLILNKTKSHIFTTGIIIMFSILVVILVQLILK